MLDDVQLQRLVADVFDRIERVPADALEVAYSAIGMASLSEELATLVFDSAVDAEPVLMRSSAQELRSLTYEREGVTLHLELHDDGVTIVGLIDTGAIETGAVDAGAGSSLPDMVVEVEAEDGRTISAAVDEHGRFRVVGPAGDVRLRIPGRLVTPWISRRTGGLRPPVDPPNP